MTEEKELIIQCQQGNPERFAELYLRYSDRIYEYIYYKTMHKETAEDLLSVTFLKALDKIVSFKTECSFQAWLYAIARNAVIDHYRKVKPEYSLEDAWGVASSGDIAFDADVASLLEEVRKYLSKLKSGHREIVIMRVWQGLSYGEIAEITGKSEAGVKMQFSRTINELRGDLQGLLAIVFLMLMR